MIKEPYFTEEERKEKWFYSTEHYRFKTCNDLSCGVVVEPAYSYDGDGDRLYDYPPKLVALAVSMFIANFMLWNYPRLNGFAGIDCITWEFTEKKEESKDEYVDDPNAPWNIKKSEGE